MPPTVLGNILSVEDEPDIQAIIKLSLETIGGFNTLICSSGEEALRLAPDFNPDLILLDVMMPGMDGPETFLALQKHPALKDKPVAFMTAKVMQNEVERLGEMGAIGVIAKPFDPMTLPEQIRKLWNKRHAR